MAGYYHANYWHANYWHSNYWGVNVPASTDGDYWHTGYWHGDYWHGNFWANGGTSTLIVSQRRAQELVLTPFVLDVVTTLVVIPSTATRTLAGFAATVANSVTVTATTPTLTLTAIATTKDSGEFYEGDISFAVYASSAFDYTDVVGASLATLNLTGISPGVSVETGDVIVQVTSTPAMTLSALPTQTANPVVVSPITPSMTLTEFNVTTGFGTLVAAGVASRTLSTLQTNVTGVNADINEFAATRATMFLAVNNPEVISVEEEATVGGHFLPGLVGVRAGRKRTPKRVLEELEEIVEEVTAEILQEASKKPIRRVSKARRSDILKQATERALSERVIIGEIEAVEKAVRSVTRRKLKQRRRAIQNGVFKKQSDELARIQDEEDALAAIVLAFDLDVEDFPELKELKILN